jgi:endonuclease III
VLLRLDAAGLTTWPALAVASPEVLRPLLAGSAYPTTRARSLPRLAAAVLDAGGCTSCWPPVVDAYLRRVLGRLGLVDPTASYAVIRADLARMDTGGVGWDVLHALVVEHGIHHCLTGVPRCAAEGAPKRNYAEPRKCAEHCPPCAGCPLSALCPRRGVSTWR